jgi:hypothetical protein
MTKRKRRIPYGKEDPAPVADGPCPDCGVMPGEYHRQFCDQERCPYCGGQKISCGCRLVSVRNRGRGGYS